MMEIFDKFGRLLMPKKMTVPMGLMVTLDEENEGAYKASFDPQNPTFEMAAVDLEDGSLDVPKVGDKTITPDLEAMENIGVFDPSKADALIAEFAKVLSNIKNPEYLAETERLKQERLSGIPL